MTTAEATPEKAKCPTLEITKQDFFQEAKTLIAQHYEKINENKVQGTSINVFRKKHQKLKSGKYLPLEIDKKETHDVVQEHRAALRRICFPKELSKSEHLQEPPQQISFKEPHIFSRRERCRPIDLITKGQVKLDKIMTIIEPVSKKMETAKQQHFEESSNCGYAGSKTARDTVSILLEFAAHCPQELRLAGCFLTKMTNMLPSKRLFQITKPDSSPDIAEVNL
ncbi:hypothetical protein H8957_008806 [Semnopithecus entellus]